MTATSALCRTDIDSVESAREKLIVALDFWTIDEAKLLVEELSEEVTLYKVGLGLQLVGGDALANWLIRRT